MGGPVPSTVGDWLFVLAISAGIYLPALIAVITERSSLRAGRASYLIAFLIGVVGPLAIVWLLDELVSPSDGSFTFAWMAAWLVLQVWFYRVLVRRTRDAGHGRSLAYWAVAPLVGSFICIYLLFPATKPASV